MTDTQIEIIEKIQASQKNIKITFGSIIGIMLILFFFTYASLIDKAPPLFIEIEVVLSIIFVPALFLLNRISFAWIKLFKGRKTEYKDIIKKLHPNDVDKNPEEILERLK